MRALPLLAIVLVIRYFAIGGGPLLNVQASFGWSQVECQAKKLEIDAQPDPKGLKTIIDCVEEADLPSLLARGDRV